MRDPVVATQGLITRVLGAPFLSHVSLQAIPADPAAPGSNVFELDAGTDGKLVIRGNTGVAMSMGLGYWLKYSTNSSWAWGRNGTGNNIRIPNPLPVPPAKQRVVAPVEKSYYMNVCTLGYCEFFGRCGVGVLRCVRVLRGRNSFHRVPPPLRPSTSPPRSDGVVELGAVARGNRPHGAVGYQPAARICGL